MNVHSMLRISGDLSLAGVPDRPGSPGSWPLLPIVNLVGNGYMEFQVGLESFQQQQHLPLVHWTLPSKPENVLDV
jgi:hypothetical protein